MVVEERLSACNVWGSVVWILTVSVLGTAGVEMVEGDYRPLAISTVKVVVAM